MNAWVSRRKVLYFFLISFDSNIDQISSFLVFFDNEHYNIKQVAKLGVKCIYTPDGMRKHHWEEAKQKFNL